jgi:hypothetical protein
MSNRFRKIFVFSTFRSNSPMSIGVSTSSLDTTSITKTCFHTVLWPLEKNSSQWKHLSSLRHYAISTGVSLFVCIAEPLIEAIDEACLELMARVAGLVGGRPKTRDTGRAEVGGGVACRESCWA